jgi:hypothetical protein
MALELYAKPSGEEWNHSYDPTVNLTELPLGGRDAGDER